MSSAIEVLKKKANACNVCKWDGGDFCKASEGEFGECTQAEELFKAISEAIMALEKLEKLRKDAVTGFNYMSSQAKTCSNKEYAKGSRDVWQEVLERVGEQR